MSSARVSDDTSTPEADMAPVVDDLSVFILGGRVHSARSAIAEAQDAEQLGFSQVWLCERFELKEAGAILGAAAAVTSRLGVATAPVVPSSRFPLVLASLGTTLQSLSEGRFTMGVGRGSNPKTRQGWGFNQLSYEGLIDYCGMLKRLWSGERVAYDGPAGSFSNMQLHDLPDGPPPKLVFCHNGGPKASAVAADPVFDGTMPTPLLSIEALHHSISWTRAQCARISRDPATLTISAGVASAPELDEAQAQALISVRLLFSFLAGQTGRDFARFNGWDMKVVDAVQNHPYFSSVKTNTVDQAFNTPEGRAELVKLAQELIPESYLRDVGAVGSISECVKFLQEVKGLGVDEMVLYTTTGAQNADLLAAWRNQK